MIKILYTARERCFLCSFLPFFASIAMLNSYVQPEQQHCRVTVTRAKKVCFDLKFSPKITTPETSCFSENHQGGKEVQCHWLLKPEYFLPSCVSIKFSLWKQSEWLFNKIKELLKSFPRHFAFTAPFIFFAQIMELIEPVFFCGLYCMAHPLPFLFMGGLPRGIWILGSIQNWDNVKDTVLKFGAGRPPGSGSKPQWSWVRGVVEREDAD